MTEAALAPRVGPSHLFHGPLLRHFCTGIKSTFRLSDVPARLGGDEFVVLMMDTPENQVQIVIDRLKEALKKDDATTHRPYALSFSYGIAKFDPEKPVSLDNLMAESDERMYEDKATKNNSAR
jgi:diguanylate cyclase (GGDEF)-like protein